jgi:hypothetical protein
MCGIFAFSYNENSTVSERKTHFHAFSSNRPGRNDQHATTVGKYCNLPFRTAPLSAIRRLLHRWFFGQTCCKGSQTFFVFHRQLDLQRMGKRAVQAAFPTRSFVVQISTSTS